MTRPGVEPRSPGPLANTWPDMPMVLKNTQTCPNSKKYTHIVPWTSSMYQGYKNGKKKLTYSQYSHVDLLFHGKVQNNVSLVQRTKAKVVKNEFLNVHVTTQEAPNGHTHSQREIIYCLFGGEGGAYLLSDLTCASFKQAGKQRNSRWRPRLFITTWPRKVAQIITARVQRRWSPTE